MNNNSFLALRPLLFAALVSLLLLPFVAAAANVTNSTSNSTTSLNTTTVNTTTTVPTSVPAGPPVLLTTSVASTTSVAPVSTAPPVVTGSSPMLSGYALGAILLVLVVLIAAFAISRAKAHSGKRSNRRNRK